MYGSQVLSVSALTRMIKDQLEQGPFTNIALVGEISNFKHHSSGHMYFTLKDDRSRIKAVMFRGKNQYLSFVPENGMEVIALGRIGVYEANGEYQLYVEELLPQGAGALQLAFEQLKEKLEQEGLFALEHKRALPQLPRNIGVITSPTGAAVRDIINVIHRRYPLMNITIIPALVQGEYAAPTIVQAFDRVKSIDVDVVIVGRGGGSIEELWPFNEENVARAIYDCAVPVVSAVGHETDFTIADFVADLRAPTPSAGAELVVPDYLKLQQELSRLERALVRSLTNVTKGKRQQLSYWLTSALTKRPVELIRQHQQHVDELISAAETNVCQRQQGLMGKYQTLVAKLDALSPLATLARGYAVCQNHSGQVISTANQVEIGDKLAIRLKKGTLNCAVEGRVEE